MKVKKERHSLNDKIKSIYIYIYIYIFYFSMLYFLKNLLHKHVRL